MPNEIAISKSDDDPIQIKVKTEIFIRNLRRNHNQNETKISLQSDRSLHAHQYVETLLCRSNNLHKSNRFFDRPKTEQI